MWYRDLNGYLQETFGKKVYKLALNGGMTCPNRDGTLGWGGCVFCSAGGSGEFSPSAALPIPRQLAEAKERLKKKYKGNAYIAYFQSFTNTYAPVSYLRKIFYEAIQDPEVVALSIATRPDCIAEETLALLRELNQLKPVWVELGLQTSNEKTAEEIHRGYGLACFEDCVRRLKAAGLQVIVHVILGLPNETKECMIDTIEYLNQVGIHGIKLQLLHVLKGTQLENIYRSGAFQVLDLEEYTDILCDCIEHLSPDVVIHRLTGDGPRRLLIAPSWSTDKKGVRNYIHQEFLRREICQGRLQGKGESQ